MKNTIKISITLGVMLSISNSFAQGVAINENGAAPNANAILDIQSADKGVLIPRVALTSTSAAAPLAAHVQGMQVYNTATAGDVTPGMYSNDGTKWVRMSTENIYNSDNSLTSERTVSMNGHGLNFQGDNTSENVQITADGRVGIGVTAPTQELDIDGNIRVRDINSNTGNVNTDKRVVADANGVLKTVENQSPLLIGGDLSNPFSANPLTVTTTTTSNLSSGTIQSFNFVLNQQSLVTFEYTISSTTAANHTANWNDGVRRGIGTSLHLTNGPSSASGLLNQTFALNAFPITSTASAGMPGFFYTNGSQTLLLPAGSYTVEARGFIISPNTSNIVSAIFGNAASSRFTVTAIPMNN